MNNQYMLEAVNIAARYSKCGYLSAVVTLNPGNQDAVHIRVPATRCCSDPYNFALQLAQEACCEFLGCASDTHFRIFLELEYSAQLNVNLREALYSEVKAWGKALNPKWILGSKQWGKHGDLTAAFREALIEEQRNLPLPVSRDVYWQILESVPPRYHGAEKPSVTLLRKRWKFPPVFAEVFQNGEASRHDDEGYAIYSTFGMTTPGAAKFYYLGERRR